MVGPGGFRLDWEPSDANTLTFQGDYYSGEWGGKVFRSSFTPVPGVYPSDFRSNTDGGNLLARWTHRSSDDSEMSWQVFYDADDRGFGIGREQRGTLDFDAQHRFRVGERHEFVWGGGYRFSADDIEASPDFGMLEPSKGIQLVNLFVQDEVTLIPDRLRLTLGTKLEHNDFTGFELQPGARISWTPHDRHSFWAAISRAVRTPSRTERSLVNFIEPHPPVPPGILSVFTGTGRLKSCSRMRWSSATSAGD